MLRPKQLKRLRLFANFDEEQIQRFIPHLVMREYRRDEKILSIGDPGTAMYMILAGDVNVTRPVSGRDVLLARLETGDFFGEVALFDEGDRTADVRAATNCLILELRKDSFEEICRTDPAVALQFLLGLLRHFTFRLRKTTDRFADSMLIQRAGHPGRG